ncbi:MAG TPA: hypothetical protein VK210_10760, partial [Terriglobia bacterium]|nr:hypothetical protein [Terriglobia bacterium]
PDPNSLARGYFSAWMSTTRPRYYRVALGVYGLENNVRKQMRGGVIFGFSEERVPHRGGILARLSTNMGAHVDWYPRNLTIRYVPGAYRFSFVGLDQSRRAEHAVESSLDIEQRMSAGFLRLGSEGSYTLNKEHFRNLQLFSRLYLDLPVRPITGFTLDASVRWGMVTSSAPLSARFGGGQRPDPFTANPTDIDGTFAPLAGPIMRGYGMSTDALWGTDVQGRESYSGLSLTISLPGISRPTVRGVDASDRARVRNIVQTQFDNTVTAMVEQGAKRGLSDKQAVAEGTRRGLELRDTLMSVLAHGRRVVLRPLLVLDAASISPVNPLYNRLAKSVGGGVRLNGLHQNLDVLWLRNIDPLSATLGFKTRVWTIRYLVGGSFAD